MPARADHAVIALRDALEHAVHHKGASAYALFIHSPELINLIIPPQVCTETVEATDDRAIVAEEIIRRAIDKIGEADKSSADALSILLGFQGDPRTRATILGRRTQAGKLLEITPDTFRKAYEPELLLALAFGIRRIQNHARHDTGTNGKR